MFVAVVPPHDVIADLRMAVAALPEDVGLRWVIPQQWHVTLAFLADVDDEQLARLRPRLIRAAARRSTFALRPAGVVVFPRAARARLLAVGIETAPVGGPQLHRLADGIRAAASRSGIVVDPAPLRPHVTLARFRRPTDAEPWTSPLVRYRGPRWEVGDVVLIRSHLGQGDGGRPRYEVVDAYPLRTAGSE